MSRPFAFKKFVIHQQVNAMKVGVDAMILGAWCAPNPHNTILDIGTGTGILALMMAQRYPHSHITAIEIEACAAKEAAANFENSPWSSRIYIRIDDARNFASQSIQKYDFILSNPPFFSKGIPCADPKRNLARNDHSLSLNDLIVVTSKLLVAGGNCAFILPYDKKKKLLDLAEEKNMFPSKILDIKGNQNKLPHRFCVQLSYEKVKPHTGALYIRNENGTYSEEYKTLTRPYYNKDI